MIAKYESLELIDDPMFDDLAEYSDDDAGEWKPVPIFEFVVCGLALWGMVAVTVAAVWMW